MASSRSHLPSPPSTSSHIHMGLATSSNPISSDPSFIDQVVAEQLRYQSQDHTKSSSAEQRQIAREVRSIIFTKFYSHFQEIIRSTPRQPKCQACTEGSRYFDSRPGCWPEDSNALQGKQGRPGDSAESPVSRSKQPESSGNIGQYLGIC
jgi:hypothetical protein